VKRKIEYCKKILSEREREKERERERRKKKLILRIVEILKHPSIIYRSLIFKINLSYKSNETRRSREYRSNLDRSQKLIPAI